MKRRLLIATLTATMAISMITGCGSSNEKPNTTTSKVEQSDNNGGGDNTSTNAPTNESTTSKVESVITYDEKFSAEPNWEEEYEDAKNTYLRFNYSEETAEKLAGASVEASKREYKAMKFVFEDMTRRFKNKEEVSVTDSINLINMRKDCEETSLVCDVSEMVPEGSPYAEFGGFKVTMTESTDALKTKGYIVVKLNANPIQIGENAGDYYPMWMSVFVTINEDGTYSYKEINIQYMLK